MKKIGRGVGVRNVCILYVTSPYLWPGVIELITLIAVIFQGSRDNMSIVIVTFKGAPQLNQEAVKKEEELDARIEAKIKGTFLL